MCRRSNQCRHRRCDADAEAYWLYKADRQWRRLMRCYEHRPLSRRMLDLWSGICEYCFRGGKAWRAECHPMCKNHTQGENTMYQEGQATTAEVVLKSVHDEEMERNNRALIAATTERDRLRSNIKAAKQVISEAVGDDELDSEMAQKIADALGITIVTQYQYTLDVSLSITLDLPLGVDPNDIDESDFDVTLEYTGEGQMDYAQESVDLSQN